ncbi:hypothetical protein [Streptomyces chrestomyceticus]|uniref:Secreted protein n=1 Tax=Streptomyces chrestomyceticus TaxID=68185 RepID=A0ABU7X741_9ACTN
MSTAALAVTTTLMAPPAAAQPRRPEVIRCEDMGQFIGQGKFHINARNCWYRYTENGRFVWDKLGYKIGHTWKNMRLEGRLGWDKEKKGWKYLIFDCPDLKEIQGRTKGQKEWFWMVEEQKADWVGTIWDTLTERPPKKKEPPP